MLNNVKCEFVLFKKNASPTNQVQYIRDQLAGVFGIQPNCTNALAQGNFYIVRVVVDKHCGVLRNDYRSVTIANFLHGRRNVRLLSFLRTLQRERERVGVRASTQESQKRKLTSPSYVQLLSAPLIGISSPKFGKVRARTSRITATWGLKVQIAI